MTSLLRKFASTFSFGVIALTGLGAASPARGVAQSPPLRVLFIGNSYTYVNDLPSVIGDFAQAAHAPRRLEAQTVLVGGSTLERHLAQNDALAQIARGGWDYVVLQEQSQRPITAPAMMWRDVQSFADAAKKVGTKLLLYETWAREAEPLTQDSLSRSYHQAAELGGAKLAHVGEAWASFRATESVAPSQHSALFMSDGSHPSPAGTYLAACVFYATLYDKSPVGLPPVSRKGTVQPPVGPPAGAPHDSLPSALAQQLQRLAWKAVSHP